MKLMRPLKGKTVSSVSIESAADCNEMTPNREDLPACVVVRFTDDTVLMVKATVAETQYMIIPCMEVTCNA